MRQVLKLTSSIIPGQHFAKSLTSMRHIRWRGGSLERAFPARLFGLRESESLKALFTQRPMGRGARAKDRRPGHPWSPREVRA